jgi:ubiquinone/menaquinone biosynthesis C-methylase UbiE
MSESSFASARASAERTPGAGPNDLNRVWWESLPMTYAPWEQQQRSPVAAADFRRLEAEFLDSNPWLRDRFDFTAFRDTAVLEIGCGAGAASCLFARHGARVTAVDLTEAAVDLARRNAAQQGLSIDVRRGDAEALDCPDASADFVFSWGVLHHTSDTARAMSEVSRVLRPGGRGLVMVYHRHSLRYAVKGLYWLIVKGKLLRGHRMASVQRFFTDGYYHRHFTAGDLTEMLAGAGLTVRTTAVTHMAKRMAPHIPVRLDDWLKARWGWLLVAEFEKPA